MRILYATNERSARVHDFYRPLQDALAAVPGVELKRIERPLDNLEGRYCRAQVIDQVHNEPLLDPAEANEYDWLLTDAMYAYMWEDWDAITVCRGIFWGDQHGPMVQGYVGAAHQRFGFEGLFPAYRDATLVFHPTLVNRFHWVPYWVNTDLFHDYGLRKSYPALQTGVVHAIVYPWRHRVWEALQGEPYFRRIQRPAEDINREGYWPVGVDYARLLNRAILSFGCTSKFGYPLTKLFEIPACRCALMTDWIPEMKALGFIPGENCLLYEGDTAPQLREYIEGWLAQPDRLQEIATAGMELMHTRHNVHKRARDLVRLLSTHPTYKGVQ